MTSADAPFTIRMIQARTRTNRQSDATTIHEHCTVKVATEELTIARFAVPLTRSTHRVRSVKVERLSRIRVILCPTKTLKDAPRLCGRKEGGGLNFVTIVISGYKSFGKE